MSSFSPSIFPSLLFSFNLQEIAQEAYNNHQSLSQPKQEKHAQIYKLHQLFTPQGINLCQLFGYYLSKRLQKCSLKQRSQQARIVWYDYKDFQNLMLNTWTNMGDYQSLLPALFQLFKQSFGGYINAKHIDQLAQISRQTIKCDTMAMIKQKVSPQSLLTFQKRVFQLAQKQDLKGTGFIQTKKIVSIFSQLHDKSVVKQIDLYKLPKQLFQNEMISYQMMFSQEYLLSGKKLKEFMQGFCARRIIKLIKKSNKRKHQLKQFKSQYLKKVIKKQQPLLGQKGLIKTKKQQQKQQLKQQIISELLQKDNKQTKQLMRNKLLTAKQLLMEIIMEAVELAQNVFMRQDREMESSRYQEAKKTVYTIEPIVGERVVENVYREGTKVDILGAGIGMFLADGQGYSFQLAQNSQLITNKTSQSQIQSQSASTLTPINLSISSLIKSSNIIDYQILHQKLYILRQDGLFYVWSYSSSQLSIKGQEKKKDCYQKMIQTGYKSVRNQHLEQFYKRLSHNNNKSTQNSHLNKVINLDKEANLFTINCSSDPISPSVQIYDSELNYIGRIPISKTILGGFKYEHLLQARYFLTKICPYTKSDQVIKDDREYLQLLKKYGYVCNNKKQQQRLLGMYLLRMFQNNNTSLQIHNIELYFKHVTNSTKHNTIHLNEQWYNQLTQFKHQKRKLNKLSKQVVDYLLEMNYIIKGDDQKEIKQFLLSSEIKAIRDRKCDMMSLVEDNYNVFDQLVADVDNKNSNKNAMTVPNVVVSQQKLIKLLSHCDLSNEQINTVLQSLTVTVDNFIDLTYIMLSQHILRLRDNRENKRSSQRKYKIMSMPSSQIQIVGVVLKSDALIVRLKQSPMSHQRVYFINTNGQIITVINMLPSSYQSYTPLVSTYIAQTNSLMCMKHNTIYIYCLSYLNSNNITNSNSLNSSSLSLQPTKIIYNIHLPQINQNNNILSLNYSYQQGSLFIMTLSTLYVFDFQELVSTKNQSKKFRVKPGYIAIFDNKKDIQPNNNPNSSRQQKSHQIKRKHLTPANQYNSHLIVSPTKFNQSIVTIVSYNLITKDLHIKSIYLLKHLLKVTKQQLSKPIPTKLFRQLQARAKRTYYQDNLKDLAIKQLTDYQNSLIKDITNFYKKKLSLINKNTQQKSQNPTIQNRISSIQTNKKTQQKLYAIMQLNNIYGLLNNTKSIIKTTQKMSQKYKLSISQKYLRLYVVITVLLAKQEQDLEDKLSTDFINMYRSQQKYTNRKQLMNDFSTIEQKKFTDRLLYFCSLIDKFVMTLIVNDQQQVNNNKYSQKMREIIKQLICDQKGNLSIESVVGIVCQQQQVVLSVDQNNIKIKRQKMKVPPQNLVESTFSILNQLNRLSLYNSIDVITSIILYRIPTKYKYLSPRYYKQLLSFNKSNNNYSKEQQNDSDPCVNEFISNNFDNGFINSLSMSTHQFITANVSNSLAPQIIPTQGIRELLIKKNKLKLYTHIQSRHPQVNKNYRKLVQYLYAYRVISLFEMVFMITSDKVSFVQREQNAIRKEDSNNNNIKKVLSRKGNKLKDVQQQDSINYVSLDEVIEQIHQNITTNHIILPKPFITKQYFTSTLYPYKQSQSIYNKHFSLASTTIHQSIYTRSLMTMMELVNDKNLSLQYDQNRWSSMIDYQLLRGLFVYQQQLTDVFRSKRCLIYKEFVACLQKVMNLTNNNNTNANNTNSNSNKQLNQLVYQCCLASIKNTNLGDTMRNKLSLNKNINMNKQNILAQYYISTQSFIKHLTKTKKQLFDQISPSLLLMSKDNKSKDNKDNLSSNYQQQQPKQPEQPNLTLFQSTISIPISKLVHQLWRSGNFLDKQQLLNILKWSLNQIKLKSVNEWIQNSVNWIKVNTNNNHSDGKIIEHNKQLIQYFIDPLQLPLIKKHLQLNINLTLQTIAYNLYHTYQTLQFPKLLITKNTQVNSFISYKQLVKFVGSQSITRYLFRLKDQTQSIHLDDVIVICKKLKQVICEKVWRYNLLVWGKTHIKCLLGLLKAFAQNNSNNSKVNNITRGNSNNNNISLVQSGRRKKRTKFSQLAKYFIPSLSQYSQQQQLVLIAQTSQWVTVLKYVCEKYYKHVKNMQQLKQRQSKSTQNKQSKQVSKQSRQYKQVNAIEQNNNKVQASQSFNVDSDEQIAIDQFYNCIEWNIKRVSINSIKQVRKQLTVQSSYQNRLIQQLMQLSQPHQLTLINTKSIIDNDNKGIVINNQSSIHTDLISPQIIQKVYQSKSISNSNTNNNKNKQLSLITQFLPSQFTIKSFIQLKQSLIKSSITQTTNYSNNKITTLPIQYQSLLRKLYKSILEKQSHQNNTLSQFYHNVMKSSNLTYQFNTSKNNNASNQLSNVNVKSDNKQNKDNLLLLQVEIKFAEFYSKLKSYSPKILAKLSCYQLSIIYQLLNKNNNANANNNNNANANNNNNANANNNNNNGDRNSTITQSNHLISYHNLFTYSSVLITGKIKQSWLYNYLLTKKTIQYLSTKNNNKTQQSQQRDQQVQQYRVNLNIYGEMIVGNLWHQPVDYYLQTQTNKQHLQSIINKLTQCFDLRHYVFNKYFGKKQSNNTNVENNNINNNNTNNSKVVQQLTKLSTTVPVRQFIKKLRQFLQNEQDITEIQGVILYEYFSKSNDRAIIVSNNSNQSETQTKVKLEDNNKRNSILLYQCIGFLISQSNKQNRYQNSNTNLLPTIDDLLTQYPLLMDYFQSQQLLLRLSTHQLSASSHYYINRQTLLQQTFRVLMKMIISQNQIRQTILTQVDIMLKQMNCTLEDLCQKLSLSNQNNNSSKREQSQQPATYSTMIGIPEYIIRALVISRIDSLKDISLFQQINLHDNNTNQHIRQVIIQLITKSICQFDTNNNQRSSPSQLNTLSLNDLREQLKHYHYNKTYTTKALQQGNHQSKDINKTGSQLIMSYQQVYKSLDVLGIGEVNLTDIIFSNNNNIKSIAINNTQPYVNISTYLHQQHPYLNKSIIYIKPNTNLLNNSQLLITQLLNKQQQSYMIRQQEISSTGYSTHRTKIISKSNTYKIFYPYLDQNQLQFILEYFDVTNCHKVSKAKVNNKHKEYQLIGTKQSSNFINLSRLIQYLTRTQQNQSNINDDKTFTLSKSTKQTIKLLVQWIENEGGIKRILRSDNQLLKRIITQIMNSCNNDIKLGYQNVADLVIDVISYLAKQLSKQTTILTTTTSMLQRLKQQLKATFAFYPQQCKVSFTKNTLINIDQLLQQYLIPSLQQVLDYHYQKQLNLNSTSNQQLNRLKQLPIGDFSLLKKMYIALAQNVNNNNNKLQINSKYQIYQLLITSTIQDTLFSTNNNNQQSTDNNKKTFTLLDLWQFINKHSMVPSSRKQINSIFRIIDENNDKQIQFKEFVAFYMAVEQVLPRSILRKDKMNSSFHSSIQDMKYNLRKAFISIFSHRIMSNTRSPITYSDIMSTFNTSNKQKINKLLQIIFQNYQTDNQPFNLVQFNNNKGYDQKIIINGVVQNVLDMSRLKGIARVTDILKNTIDSNGKKDNKSKNNQTLINTTLEFNLILQWIADDLYQFISNKIKPNKNQSNSTQQKKLKRQDLFKYILLKYPSIGRAVIQSLFSLSNKQFQQSKLLTLLKKYVQKSNTAGWRSTNIGQKDKLMISESHQHKLQILNALKMGDSFAKRYHSLTKCKISHFYGESLSFRFIMQEILQEIDLVQCQVGQINMWIDKCCKVYDQKLPLIYGVKQNKQILPKYTQVKSVKDSQSLMLKRFKQLIGQKLNENTQSTKITELKALMSGKIKLTIDEINLQGSNYLQQTLQLTKDTRFKSSNLANFSLNLILYSDQEISVNGCINVDDLRKSKGQQIIVYFAENDEFTNNNEIVTTKPILQLKRPEQESFSCLNSLIKLAQLNYKIHKKYRVTGLFMDLDNICYKVNNLQQQKNEGQFLLKHFYQGVVLSPDGNYAEGFNLLQLYSNQQNDNHNFKVLSLPPQLQENIYTYSMDSYAIGYLIFMLYTGMEYEEIKQKEKEIKDKRNTLSKEALKNKIEPSFYMDHSFVHNEAKKRISQLMKKISQNKRDQSQSQLQAQLILFTLVYKCTLYNWYERPQMYQILSALKQLQQNLSKNNPAEQTQFFRLFNQQQKVLKYFEQKDVKSLQLSIKDTGNKKSQKQQIWRFDGLIKLKENIHNFSSENQQKQGRQLSICLFEYFNKKVEQYLLNLKQSSPLFVRDENNNGSSLMFMKSKSNKFNSNNKLQTPKNLSHFNQIKFGQTQKSLFIDSRQDWNKSSSVKKGQLSPKKTFLQSQSMIFAQKQASHIIESDNNTDDVYDSKEAKDFTQSIEKLLQLVISHISSIGTKSNLHVGLYLLKNLLNDDAIKNYLQECDNKWLIPMYDVQGKRQQVNLLNKLQKLPKNSIFYRDYCQLMEEKIILRLINDQNQQPLSSQVSNTNSNNKLPAHHQSSKILALNHIVSILMSNNLNKLNALQHSNIVSKLYINLTSQDIELKQKTLQIFLLLTKSLNCQSQNAMRLKKQRKGINQIYRLMMVVYDQLSKGMVNKNQQGKVSGDTSVSSPTKRSSSFRISSTNLSSPKKVLQSSQQQQSTLASPTISLLTYTQNMYTISGQECLPLLQRICRQQLCHLYSLIILSEQIYSNRSDERYMEILSNLLSDCEMYNKMNNHLIGLLTGNKIKVMRKSAVRWAQVQQKLMNWQNDFKLLQLSSELQNVLKKINNSSSQQSIQNVQKYSTKIIQCIDTNISYYNHLMDKSTKNDDDDGQNTISLGEYNSFSVHFESMLSLMIKIINIFIHNINNDQKVGNKQTKRQIQVINMNLLLKTLTYMHVTIQNWQTNQTLIAHLIQLLQKFYSQPTQDDIYLQNKTQQQCKHLILRITQYLTVKQTALMIDQGFIHVYNNVLKKQYKKMLISFQKRVQKSKVVPVYFVQAQWRLTILQAFMSNINKTNKNNKNSSQSFDKQKEIAKQLSNLQFSHYVCQQLLNNETLMDLRFYQSFEQGVPFRFCRPFKSQALVMIGILLKSNQTNIGIQSQIAIHLVPLIQPMTEQLKTYFNRIQQDLQITKQKQVLPETQLLEIVEIIWLFSQISNSNDQRLKYQFINSGTHQVLQTIFVQYKKIKILFPNLSQIISSNKILTTSKVFQKSQLYQSRKQWRKSQSMKFN